MTDVESVARSVNSRFLERAGGDQALEATRVYLEDRLSALCPGASLAGVRLRRQFGEVSLEFLLRRGEEDLVYHKKVWPERDLVEYEMPVTYYIEQELRTAVGKISAG